MKNQRAVVGCVDALHQAVRPGFGATNFSLQQGIETPLYVARCERAAIAKLHPRVQMKNVSLRIGNFPALREPRLHAQMLVSGQQVIEQQAVNSLRLRIEPDPRIKISGAEFDDHHQRVGIRAARAGEQPQATCESDQPQKESEPESMRAAVSPPPP